MSITKEAAKAKGGSDREPITEARKSTTEPNIWDQVFEPETPTLNGGSGKNKLKQGNVENGRERTDNDAHNHDVTSTNGGSREEEGKRRDNGGNDKESDHSWLVSQLYGEENEEGEVGDGQQENSESGHVSLTDGNNGLGQEALSQSPNTGGIHHSTDGQVGGEGMTTAPHTDQSSSWWNAGQWTGNWMGGWPGVVPPHPHPYTSNNTESTQAYNAWLSEYNRSQANHYWRQGSWDGRYRDRSQDRRYSRDRSRSQEHDWRDHRRRETSDRERDRKKEKERSSRDDRDRKDGRRSGRDYDRSRSSTTSGSHSGRSKSYHTDSRREKEPTRSDSYRDRRRDRDSYQEDRKDRDQSRHSERYSSRRESNERESRSRDTNGENSSVKDRRDSRSRRDNRDPAYRDRSRGSNEPAVLDQTKEKSLEKANECILNDEVTLKKQENNRDPPKSSRQAESKSDDGVKMDVGLNKSSEREVPNATVQKEEKKRGDKANQSGKVSETKRTRIRIKSSSDSGSESSSSSSSSSSSGSGSSSSGSSSSSDSSSSSSSDEEDEDEAKETEEQEEKGKVEKLESTATHGHEREHLENEKESAKVTLDDAQSKGGQEKCGLSPSHITRKEKEKDKLQQEKDKRSQPFNNRLPVPRQVGLKEKIKIKLKPRPMIMKQELHMKPVDLLATDDLTTECSEPDIKGNVMCVEEKDIQEGEKIGKEEEKIGKEEEKVGKEEEIGNDVENMGKEEDIRKEEEEIGKQGEEIGKQEEDIRKKEEEIEEGKDGKSENHEVLYPHESMASSLDVPEREDKNEYALQTVAETSLGANEANLNLNQPSEKTNQDPVINPEKKKEEKPIEKIVYDDPPSPRIPGFMDSPNPGSVGGDMNYSDNNPMNDDIPNPTCDTTKGASTIICETVVSKSTEEVPLIESKECDVVPVNDNKCCDAFEGKQNEEDTKISSSDIVLPCSDMISLSDFSEDSDLLKINGAVERISAEGNVFQVRDEVSGSIVKITDLTAKSQLERTVSEAVPNNVKRLVTKDSCGSKALNITEILDKSDENHTTSETRVPDSVENKSLDSQEEENMEEETDLVHRSSNKSSQREPMDLPMPAFAKYYSPSPKKQKDEDVPNEIIEGGVREDGKGGNTMEGCITSPHESQSSMPVSMETTMNSADDGNTAPMVITNSNIVTDSVNDDPDSIAKNRNAGQINREVTQNENCINNNSTPAKTEPSLSAGVNNIFDILRKSLKPEAKCGQMEKSLDKVSDHPEHQIAKSPAKPSLTLKVDQKMMSESLSSPTDLSPQSSQASISPGSAKQRRHLKWSQWKASHSLGELYKGNKNGLTVLPQTSSVDQSLLPEAKLLKNGETKKKVSPLRVGLKPKKLVETKRDIKSKNPHGSVLLKGDIKPKNARGLDTVGRHTVGRKTEESVNSAVSKSDLPGYDVQKDPSDAVLKYSVRGPETLKVSQTLSMNKIEIECETLGMKTHLLGMVPLRKENCKDKTVKLDEHNVCIVRTDIPQENSQPFKNSIPDSGQGTSSICDKLCNSIPLVQASPKSDPRSKSIGIYTKDNLTGDDCDSNVNSDCTAQGPSIRELQPDVIIPGTNGQPPIDEHSCKSVDTQQVGILSSGHAAELGGVDQLYLPSSSNLDEKDDASQVNQSNAHAEFHPSDAEVECGGSIENVAHSTPRHSKSTTGNDVDVPIDSTYEPFDTLSRSDWEDLLRPQVNDRKLKMKPKYRDVKRGESSSGSRSSSSDKSSSKDSSDSSSSKSSSGSCSRSSQVGLPKAKKGYSLANAVSTRSPVSLMISTPNQCSSPVKAQEGPINSPVNEAMENVSGKQGLSKILSSSHSLTKSTCCSSENANTDDQNQSQACSDIHSNGSSPAQGSKLQATSISEPIAEEESVDFCSEMNEKDQLRRIFGTESEESEGDEEDLQTKVERAEDLPEVYTVRFDRKPLYHPTNIQTDSEFDKESKASSIPSSGSEDCASDSCSNANKDTDSENSETPENMDEDCIVVGDEDGEEVGDHLDQPNNHVKSPDNKSCTDEENISQSSQQNSDSEKEECASNPENEQNRPRMTIVTETLSRVDYYETTVSEAVVLEGMHNDLNNVSHLLNVGEPSSLEVEVQSTSKRSWEESHDSDTEMIRVSSISETPFKVRKLDSKTELNNNSFSSETQLPGTVQTESLEVKIEESHKDELNGVDMAIVNASSIERCEGEGPIVIPSSSPVVCDISTNSEVHKQIALETIPIPTLDSHGTAAVGNNPSDCDTSNTLCNNVIDKTYTNKSCVPKDSLTPFGESQAERITNTGEIFPPGTTPPRHSLVTTRTVGTKGIKEKIFTPKHRDLKRLISGVVPPGIEPVVLPQKDLDPYLCNDKPQQTGAPGEGPSRTVRKSTGRPRKRPSRDHDLPEVTLPLPYSIEWRPKYISDSDSSGNIDKRSKSSHSKSSKSKSSRRKSSLSKSRREKRKSGKYSERSKKRKRRNKVKSHRKKSKKKRKKKGRKRSRSSSCDSVSSSSSSSTSSEDEFDERDRRCNGRGRLHNTNRCDKRCISPHTQTNGRPKRRCNKHFTCLEKKKFKDLALRDFFYKRALAGYCFVEFPSQESAHHAMLRLSGKVVPASNPPKRFKLNHASYGKEHLLVPEYSIFVGDLSEDVDDLELFQAFSKRYPSCRAAKVVHDNDCRSRGYGFVRFTSEEEQQRALQEMQNSTGIGSKAIRVSPATPKRPSFPGGPPHHMNYHDNYWNQGYWGQGGWNQGGWNQGGWNQGGWGGWGGPNYNNHGHWGGYDHYQNEGHYDQNNQHHSSQSGDSYKNDQSEQLNEDEILEDPMIPLDLEQENKDFMEKSEEFYIALDGSRWHPLDSVTSTLNNKEQ